jgi:hypothetical protein
VTGWQAWLGSLAAAAREFERRLDTGEPAAFIDLPPLPADVGAFPDDLLAPAHALLDDLAALQRRAETYQHALRERLTGLAVPRARGAAVPGYQVGAALDVTG